MCFHIIGDARICNLFIRIYVRMHVLAYMYAGPDYQTGYDSDPDAMLAEEDLNALTAKPASFVAPYVWKDYITLRA